MIVSRHRRSGLGQSNPGANCDFGILKTINFEGHNINICRQYFDDAMARAKFAYIDSNNLWSLGCVVNGIYAWPAIDAGDYSGPVSPELVASAKATYPGDHGTIYIFGAHRDDSCVPYNWPTTPFQPTGGTDPENFPITDWGAGPGVVPTLSAPARQTQPTAPITSSNGGTLIAPAATLSAHVSLQNVSNPGAVGFAAGDKFAVVVSGAAPNAAVSVTANKDGSNLGTQQLGTTSATGAFSFSDTMPASAAGHWEEDYAVGGVKVAHYSFDVGLAVQAPGQVPAPTGPGAVNVPTVTQPASPYASGYFDSILNKIAPAADVGSFLKQDVAGLPVWGWAIGAVVAGKFLFGGRR